MTGNETGDCPFIERQRLPLRCDEQEVLLGMRQAAHKVRWVAGRMKPGACALEGGGSIHKREQKICRSQLTSLSTMHHTI